MPNPADPQSLNRYTAMANNPLRFADPTGHYEACDDGACRDIYATRNGQLVAQTTGVTGHRRYVSAHAKNQIMRPILNRIFQNRQANRLVNNYLDATSEPIHFSKQDMIEMNPEPIASSPNALHENSAIKTVVDRLKAIGGGLEEVEADAFWVALTQGTLGRFTASFKGLVVVGKDGTWFLNGTIRFSDSYDFDPAPQDPRAPVRTSYGSDATAFCRAICYGSGFNITSDALNVEVSSSGDVFYPEYPDYVPTGIPNEITGGDPTATDMFFRLRAEAGR
ncbi:MAG: hypothetical protein ABIQ99_10575 [Thermoflexales bacterium]